MKTIRLFIFILLSAFSVHSSSQKCDFKLEQIYNFNTGCTFQYKTTSTSSIAGNLLTHTKIEKYTIIDKWKSENKIVYVKKGIWLSYYLHEVDDEPVMKSSEEFTETVYILDSTNHVLNACDSQLVEIKKMDNEYYTYISIYETEQGTEKKIGGTNNVFEYIDNDSLVLTPVYGTEKIYLEGVGLKSGSEWYFEHNNAVQLEGYVMNGDTTGIIWDDADFITSVKQNKKNNDIVIYPMVTSDNQLINILNIDGKPDIIVTNIKGIHQKYKRINNSSIQLTNASKGILFITIINNNISNTYKIINI